MTGTQNANQFQDNMSHDHSEDHFDGCSHNDSLKVKKIQRYFIQAKKNILNSPQMMVIKRRLLLFKLSECCSGGPGLALAELVAVAVKI